MKSITSINWFGVYSGIIHTFVTPLYAHTHVCIRERTVTSVSFSKNFANVSN